MAQHSTGQQMADLEKSSVPAGLPATVRNSSGNLAKSTVGAVYFWAKAVP